MHIYRQMPIPTRWGWWAAQQEVEEKWCESISFLRASTQMGCVSQDSHPRIGINSSRQILQKARGTKKKYGEERVHREASFRSVNLTSAIRAPPSLRRGHKTKPNKKDAPDEWHGHFNISRETSIRGWLRSINAHAKQKGLELRQNGDSAENQEHHNGDHSQWRSANKRGSTRIRARCWSLLEGANNRWHACSSITWKALRRTRWYLKVRQRLKATPKPNKGRRFSARRKIEYLLLSLDCRPNLAPVRPLHRHRRTHQLHRQVQQQSEVTMRHQETGESHQKLKTKIKRGITIETRTDVCETFRNG